MMGATELLEREAHFRKLNQELEDKTTRLMKEIEDVMNKQDNSITNFPMPKTPYSSLIKPDTHITNKPAFDRDKNKPKSDESSEKDCASNSNTKTGNSAKKLSHSKSNDKNKLHCNDTDTDCVERNHLYREKSFNDSSSESNSALNDKQISNCSTPECDFKTINECLHKSVDNKLNICQKETKPETQISKKNYDTYLMSTNTEDRKNNRSRSSTRSKDNSKREKSVTYLDKLVRQGIVDRIFPESFKDESLCGESVCRFLTSKVKMLQTELDTQNKAIRAKADECEHHMKDVIAGTEARTKLHMQNNILRERVKKQEDQIEKLTLALKESTSECLTLRSTLTRTQTTLRASESRANAAEARASRANSDADKARTAKEDAIRNEQELRESSRQHAETLTVALRKSEKQCRDAITGFRRQAGLVDNLRRQNALLAADKAMELTEKDYLRILNWDGDSK